MFNRIQSLKSRYLASTSGATAAWFALVLTSTAAMVGASTDYFSASNAKGTLQDINDSIALAAATQALDLESGRYQEGQSYDLDEFSYVMDPTIQDGTVTFEYDDENFVLTVRTEAKSPTAFASMAGVDYISISSETEVAFGVGEGGVPGTALENPLSVMFIMDNSGSMGWSDPSGGTKLENAQVAADSLNDRLVQIDGMFPDMVRTGLIAYSSAEWSACRYCSSKTGRDSIVNGLKINLGWNRDLSGYIDEMEPLGGTNSSGAMAQAATFFIAEDNKHEAKNAGNPRKILIFMTDGANNYDVSYTCTEKGWVWVEGRGRGRGNRGYWDWQCLNYETTYAYPYDEATMASCDLLKNRGVEIYSIAYDVSEEDAHAQEAAEAMLRYCATDDDHYLEAEDGVQLLEIFQGIGDNLVEEVVRIMS